jgi:hypothetical protein
MTEAEWLACDDPAAMLEFLSTSGKAGQRKPRLFVVAVLRSGWQHPHLSTEGRRAVDVGEGYADGMASRDELAVAHQDALRRAQAVGSWNFAEHYADTYASAAAAVDPGPAFFAAAAQDARGRVVGEPATIEAELKQERSCHCTLLRDIFGNPFRPTRVDPAWLSWNGGTVRKLVEAIYDERAFDRMPVLADALEDAGCSERDLLAHCRGPGPHARGCWVLDLLLGKE